MILKDHGPLDAKSLVAELLRQRAVLQQHREMTTAMVSRVADYEAKFAIPSTQVHGAIESGALQETAEVCDWIITNELAARARGTASR